MGEQAQGLIHRQDSAEVAEEGQAARLAVSHQLTQGMLAVVYLSASQHKSRFSNTFKGSYGPSRAPEFIVNDSSRIVIIIEESRLACFILEESLGALGL